MRALLTFTLLVAIAWYEGPPLVRHGHKREATIFFIVWGLALVYSIPVALGWSVPNPMDLINWALGPVTPLK